MMSWLLVLIYSLLYWSTNAVALPAYDRLANNEKQNGAHVTLVDMTKAEENDSLGQLNAEIPVVLTERHKRLSDQRRAELETLIRLSKMTEKLVSGTRGGRHVDASKVGRKKRSVFEMNLKNLRKLFKLSGQLGYKGNPAFPVVS